MNKYQRHESKCVKRLVADYQFSAFSSSPYRRARRRLRSDTRWVIRFLKRIKRVPWAAEVLHDRTVQPHVVITRAGDSDETG